MGTTTEKKVTLQAGLTPDELGVIAQRSALKFFKILNFVDRFYPTHPTEKTMMQLFSNWKAPNMEQIN